MLNTQAQIKQKIEEIEAILQASPNPESDKEPNRFSLIFLFSEISPSKQENHEQLEATTIMVGGMADLVNTSRQALKQAEDIKEVLIRALTPTNPFESLLERLQKASH